ncbi:MAG: hypothetical protein M0P73_05780 [Syntrophobacterales bacterium]|nr:hypothetical protein [Syntrophobacterales bacterium]
MRAAITALKGIADVTYDTRQDTFTVRFNPQESTTEDIIAAVWFAGRQTGREYLPQILS